MNLKKDDKGRGMLLYILDSVKYIQVEMNTQFQEYICVAIELNRSEKLLFTSIYRSPTSTDENTLQLNNLLRKISNTKYSHKLAVGDFNYPGVNWATCDTKAGPGDVEFEFVETLRDCYFFQHVSDFTRGRGSNKSSILDLILSNEEGMVSDINVDVPLGKSDHAAIGFTFNVHLDCLTNDKQVYQYNKADFEKMKDMLRLDWNLLLDKENVDDQWKLFEGEIHRVVYECVPTKCIKLNGGNRIKQESKSLRTKIKRKQRLWNRYIKDGDQEAKLEYNRVRNQ